MHAPRSAVNPVCPIGQPVARHRGTDVIVVRLWKVPPDTLNLAHIHRQDNHHIEVIANGSAQLAVDTIISLPLTWDGQPRRRAGQYAGTTFIEVRRAKERAAPSSSMHSRRCRLRLVVVGIELEADGANAVLSSSFAETKT